MIVELQGNYCPALPSFSNSNYASLLDEILNVGFVQESGSGLSVIGKTKQDSCYGAEGFGPTLQSSRSNVAVTIITTFSSFPSCRSHHIHDVAQISA